MPEAAQAMRVGLVGVGIMGRGLTRNILAGGFPLQVIDPNPQALADAVTLGAAAAASLGELAAECGTVITCLPSLDAIRSVYLAADGLLARARLGAVLIDCSTSEPALTREIAASALQCGLGFLDAPMFKTPQAAWDGTLHLVVGGSADALQYARPVLETFSERIIHAGASGSGHMIKLINNAVTVCNATILYEAFTVARKLEVDPDILREVMSVSMAASSALPGVAKRLLENDHTPLFATDVVKKDITLFTQLATSVGALTLLADGARDLIRLASAEGYGRDHYSRVATVLEKVAGIRR